jgi:hypothetical protein
MQKGSFMISNELKNRFHRFLNKHGTEGSRRHSRLGMELAQKSITNGAAFALQDQLDMELFREQFYGYEAERKRYDGSTFEKGIIGISLEYFETHPKELNLDAIRDICNMRKEDLSRCLEVYLGVIRQRGAQQRLEENITRIHLAVARSGCESIWHGGINDLAHELKLLLDKINSNRKQDINPAMNVIAINGFNIIGNGNIVNARFGELFKELDTLGENIASCQKLTPDERQDIDAEITTIKAQLSKSKPDKSLIMQSWECVEAVVTGKNLYDLLLIAAPLVKAFIAQ